MAIALADRGIMALAGLWENWRSPTGERIRSFAIITTKPNELCAELHNWMPLVLKPEAWPEWLGEEPVDETRLKSLLAPYPSDVRRHVVLAGERARRQRQKEQPVADQTGCRSLNHKRRPKSIAGHITYARRVPQSTTHGGFKMPLRKVSLRESGGFGESRRKPMALPINLKNDRITFRGSLCLQRMSQEFFLGRLQKYFQQYLNRPHILFSEIQKKDASHGYLDA
jgi:SOS response associated peptidase (SRAP)